MARTAMTLITGGLGSGKTTLVQRFIDDVPLKLAVLVNEFGDIGIDGSIIRAKNINLIELAGGCVCCELTGEFEAAVAELMQTVRPQLIVVEATGVAESDALVLEVEEQIKDVRLDCVIYIADAYTSLKYPRMGYVERTQLQAADAVLINKADLVTGDQMETVEARIRQFNTRAALVRTIYARVDVNLLLGAETGKRPRVPAHRPHTVDLVQFSYRSHSDFVRTAFEAFLRHLPQQVFRAKGFIRLDGRSHLLNYVGDRYELAPAEAQATRLVFIGPGLESAKAGLIRQIDACARA